MSALPTGLLERTPHQALDVLEQEMGLSEDELAQALGASRRTLQRWRMGTAYPQQAARQRLTELLQLCERARDTFEGDQATRQWFHSPSRYMGGVTPSEAVRVGRLDRVTAALEAFDSGIFL